MTLTPVALMVSVVSLLSISNFSEKTNVLGTQDEKVPGVKLYASLPAENPSITTTIVEADSRPVILGKFLRLNNSPLAEFSNYLVKAADKFKLDWRLLPAIAMKESGACKVIPEGSHNCWGWGIHSKGTLKFDSFPQAIDTVASGLKKNYIDKGYETPEEIMKKYAHPDSTTWAEGVLYYMNKL